MKKTKTIAGVALAALALAAPAQGATLAARVRHHEAHALQIQARELRVQCTGRVCHVRTCQPFGQVSLNGVWHALPWQWVRETVTVPLHGKWIYGTLTFGGACRS